LRVIFAYKNFSANKNISHIGLGVAGLNTSKFLNHQGIHSEVWPIVDSNDLRQKLNLYHAQHPHRVITHVVISAPWIPTAALNQLCQLFHHIKFAVNCHSNVGFLQADPNGMRLVREGLDLEMATPNFKIAANSKKMAKWVEHAYGNPCAYLPNLYFLHRLVGRHRPCYSGGPLKIGCFGAIRPQKNLSSAVAACIEVAHTLKVPTQVWISSGRSEGGGDVVLRTVKEMVKGLPNLTLHESGWQTWPSFRRLVGSMHLLLQPSYTESFNMVTADGISESVPSVVGEAIDWVPTHWQANADDVFDIARVGRYLLAHQGAAEEGLNALQHHNSQGFTAWQTYLTGAE
jgi:glycosyltransferase involved in cell wall biosynthesis